MLELRGARVGGSFSDGLMMEEAVYHGHEWTRAKPFKGGQKRKKEKKKKRRQKQDEIRIN